MNSALKEILYIEDDQLSTLTMRHIFKKKFPGLKLVEASTAQQGIELAIRRRPFLILVDILLPDMSGYESLNYLQTHEKTRLTPVWAVTACAMDSDIRRGMEAGFERYITKPIDMKRFIQLMNIHVINVEV
ncbi:response regulator [Paenibacillus sp. Z6-24]